ncbi:MAG TPA: hypothetical protein VLG69_01325 [Candidatus Andersenbacteria bacterium]|nr:hypothetical protein [Candidatus Andersenbacteria bacterium]
MTSINALGVRMAIGILIITGIGFGTWKLAVLGFSHTPIEQPAATPIANTATSSSPVPIQSFSPEVLKQMAEYATKTSKNIGPQTKKYVETLPKDATQTQVLDQTALTQYVAANKGDLLQPLPAGLLKTTTASGKSAIKSYLDQISPTQNKKIQNVTGDSIATAFQNEQSGTDPKALTPILASINANFDIFKAILTPKEAEPLQTKLLQATHALVINIQAMQSFKQDPISGLIGLKNVSDLDAVYADISTQISVLEKKYNLQ